MSTLKTSEQFIEDSRKVHGDKYDYSKVEYINDKTKVCIICPIHGEFWQTPRNHIQGKGCRYCQHRSYKYTSEEFIEQAKKVHGDKYDYSKVEYVNNHTKVCIICPIHGEFLQTPNSHLNGNSCKKCGQIKIGNYTRKTTEQFILEAKEIHGDKYDYSKVEYVNANTKVCIICPIHGEFMQSPHKHINGKRGCSKCNGGVKSDLKTFIKLSKEIHDNKYDYSKVKYINANTKVCIICPMHGEFFQTPHNHINGRCGCPKCRQSKMESEIICFLTDNNIKFEYQKKFKWLGRLSLDFYLPEYNIAIECQGEQHFEPIKHFGGENKFNKTKERDNKKIKLCEDYGLSLLHYTNLNNVEESDIYYKLFKTKELLLEEILKHEKVYNIT